MFKNKLVFAGFASVSLALGACGAEEAAEVEEADAGAGEVTEEMEVLEVATSADFPPFESRNTEGDFVGFDIDLANYIADELGYDLEITDMKFDGLIGALQSERVDMVISGMSATDERKENVDFSTAYHHSGEMFLTQAGSDIDTLEDLEGTVVGVQLGTIQEDGAQKLLEEEDLNFELKALDNAGLLIQELMSGRIDVVYMDESVATGYIEEQGLEGFADPTTSSPGMAVAFPKGSELVDEVNAVLAEAEESGYLAELEEKWLSEEE
ncbi:ABC transporter substrate-binding protein [Planococcus lenghuensis]|uniref:ABC transporter substrate-binding protein n=1 Tax=Planococcus lenghuensis TaxID=2213202 RepID=A0A1Q2L0M3_9BACL|nr:ABC transporter substrate-binding protein [Planococcus lenghuensis]AQQ53981.1 ABC transporter substrate-binding protein [Planococcus lenghuensis]